MNDEVKKLMRLLEQLEARHGKPNLPDQGQRKPLNPPAPDFKGASWAELKRILDPIEWDWPGWLPRGFVTLIASEPGMGKSYLCLRLAASYIEGKALPDGRPFEGQQGRVIWCEGEGSQALNLDRARAWRLDLSNIVTPLPNPMLSFRMDDEKHMLSLLTLCRRPEVRLVIMDSLSSLVLGGPTPSGSDSKIVRGIPRALHQLNEFARVTKVPIIVTHHLRKRTALDDRGRVDLQRVRGTSKIAQFARVVWTLDAPDAGRAEVQEIKNRRLMVLKNNLALPVQPIGMRIGPQGVTFGQSPQPTPDPKSPLEAAIDFLLDLLGPDLIPTKEIYEAAYAAGHKKTTLLRAKKQINAISRHLPNQNAWGWQLPSQPIPPPDS